MKTKTKPRFNIHATAVAKEHFLDDDLQRCANSTFRRTLKLPREADGTFYLCPVFAPKTGKPFVAAVKGDGNEVHFFIGNDLPALVDDVRAVFPNCPMTCAP